MLIHQSSILNELSGIQHGFGNALEPLFAQHRDQWRENRPLFKQVHGTICCEILNLNQNCGESDGFFTKKENVPIGIFTADCVPVLLARKDSKAVAALHAGWKGTIHSIIEAFANILKQNNDHPNNWIACVGPAIGPCCYQVSDEIALQFQARFQNILSKSEITPSYRMLNLPRINQAILTDCEFSKTEIIEACTYCSLTTQDSSTQHTFYSFRRGCVTERQLSSIEIST